MKELTDDEQDLLYVIEQLKAEIHSRLIKVDELTGMLIGPSDKLTVEDIDFWISKLPPGFYKTELRVLKVTLNEKNAPKQVQQPFPVFKKKQK